MKEQVINRVRLAAERVGLRKNPYTLHAAQPEPTSIVQVTRHQQQSRTESGEVVHDAYMRLAGRRLDIFEVSHADASEKEYAVVGRPMDINTVKLLLNFVRPDIDRQFSDSLIQNTLDEHLLGPVQPRERQQESYDVMRNIVDLLIRNSPPVPRMRRRADLRDELIPVIRWRKRKNGQRELVLDLLDDAMKRAFINAIPLKMRDISKLDAGLGAFLLATYSRDIVSELDDLPTIFDIISVAEKLQHSDLLYDFEDCLAAKTDRFINVQRMIRDTVVSDYFATVDTTTPGVYQFPNHDVDVSHTRDTITQLALPKEGPGLLASHTISTEGDRVIPLHNYSLNRRVGNYELRWDLTDDRTQDKPFLSKVSIRVYDENTTVPWDVLTEDLFTVSAWGREKIEGAFGITLS